MSVLVKGMKMPEGCVVCPFAERIPPGRTRCLITCRMLSDGYHAPSAWRNECCPLVEIPVPHGRLIDADALKNRLTAFVYGEANLNYCIADYINTAATVIEAEEDQEE